MCVPHTENESIAPISLFYCALSGTKIDTRPCSNWQAESNFACIHCGIRPMMTVYHFGLAEAPLKSMTVNWIQTTLWWFDMNEILFLNMPTKSSHHRTSNLIYSGANTMSTASQKEHFSVSSYTYNSSPQDALCLFYFQHHCWDIIILSNARFISWNE